MSEGSWLHPALLWRKNCGACDRAGFLVVTLVSGYSSSWSRGNSMHCYHIYPEMNEWTCICLSSWRQCQWKRGETPLKKVLEECHLNALPIYTGLGVLLTLLWVCNERKWFKLLRGFTINNELIFRICA